MTAILSPSLAGLLAQSKTVGVVATADITNEEAELLKSRFSGAELYSYSSSVNSSSEDEATDHLLRRKDKSPNLKGLESAGYQSFEKFNPESFDLVLFVSGAPYVRPMPNVTAVANEDLTMKCHVTGYPIHEIKWFKGKLMFPICLATRISI